MHAAAIETAMVDAEVNGPDRCHVAEGFKRFLVDYVDLDGREFSVDLWARDQEDAESRCRALRQTGKVAGQVFHRRDVAAGQA